LVAAALDGERDAIEAIRGEGLRVSSALTFAEARRVIVRARFAGRISSAAERSALRRISSFEDRVSIVAIDQSVLRRLGRPFPVEPVRSLDAIHLATVELLEESPQLITMATRDHRIRANARAMGVVVE